MTETPDTPEGRHADNEQGVQQLAGARARYDAGELLVPPGVDMLDGLTVAELDTASRQIKCDVIDAVAGKDGLRWSALPRVAWLWARRRDPQRKLQPFLDLSASELGRLLGLDDDDDDDQAQEVDTAANPTDYAPA